MRTRGDRLATNHVLPQEGIDNQRCSIAQPGIIKIKKGKQHSKLHRVHIKSTHNLPKVLVAHLFELKVPLLHVAHTPHSTKTYGDHWQRDCCATTGMAACTFPCRVWSQIARQDTQCKQLVWILIDFMMKAIHKSLILASSREKASFVRTRAACSTPPCASTFAPSSCSSISSVNIHGFVNM